MANQAAKKQKAKNEADIAWFRQWIAIIFGVYLLVRFGLFYSSLSNWHIFGIIVMIAVTYFAFSLLSGMAKSSYDEQGELIDGGASLSGGIAEYYKDAIYITWFVQVSTLLSDWFWFAYLTIPGYGFYKLWINFLGPWIFSKNEPEGPLDEKTRKKLEKQERKANKVKFVKGRK